MRILLSILLICFFNQVNAQYKVSGFVVNEKGEPIAFASVVYGKTGVQTQANGEFSLNVKYPKIRLEISYVGYSSKTLILDSSNYSGLKIELVESRTSLCEVVVTGYGVRSKKSMSVSSVSMAVSPVTTTKGRKSTWRNKQKGPGSISGKDSEALKDRNSKLLTASELNDFFKWTLWNDYNKDDFSRYVSHYKISFTKRFSVQLVNEKDQAIVNKSVTLRDQKTGSVVWNSITDNTGKAELWDIRNNESDYKNLVAEFEGKQFPVNSFEQGVNIINIANACAVQDEVDIAFIVDATGSMQDEINYLKDEIQDIIGTVSSTHKFTRFRYASVFYRDYSDDYVTRKLPFTQDVKSLSTFIDQQNAGGGGDYPEAVKSALEVSIDSLDWNAGAKARLAFLVLDAPPHEGEVDSYYKLIRRYAAKGIRLIPIVCSGAEKSVEFLMRNAALATNGTYCFLTDDSGIGHKHMKPTTDNYDVQLLNNLMIQIINRMIFTINCDQPKADIKKSNPFVQTESKKRNVVIYPNPTRSWCRLESDFEVYEIFVADFTGKILEKINIKNPDMRYNINLGKYPAGTYLIFYVDQEGKRDHRSVVKF